MVLYEKRFLKFWLLLSYTLKPNIFRKFWGKNREIFRILPAVPGLLVEKYSDRNVKKCFSLFAEQGA